MRSVALLGATGSIGRQALDIIRRYPDQFHISALAARSNADALFDLIREFRPEAAALAVKPDRLPEDVRFCSWRFGEDAAEQTVREVRADDVLLAVVGVAGLPAALAALDVSQRLLLANKEALVTGGTLVMQKAAERNVPLLPVDSEHSAIFQCLQARQGNPLRRLLLTASGGALRDWRREDMYRATVRDVLAHPTWTMGGKITVDCASMVNKGLEIIEAHHLFGMPADRIDVVVHPQSIVHSMIEFEDGAVLAQMGMPDMRGPIGYAMGWPERLPYDARPLDFFALGHLDFLAPDFERYPALKMAIASLKAGGNAPVVLNGANEAAVGAFLREQIPFGRIPEIIGRALESVPRAEIRSIADVYAADAAARSAAENAIRRCT